ncbi:hypothetical protein VPH35_136635 [Triticum aestivum]
MACNLAVVIWFADQEIRFPLGGWLESFAAGRWLPDCGIQIHFQSAGCCSAHDSIPVMEFLMQPIRRYPIVEEVSESEQEMDLPANRAVTTFLIDEPSAAYPRRCVSYRTSCWEDGRARRSSLNYQLVR